MSQLRKASETSPRTGRPPVISRESVIEAGVQVGLPDLSVKAVANRLGVGPTALYHHVESLRDLQIAVGEKIIGSLELRSSTADAASYLLELARALRALESRHPGIGAFCAAAPPEATTTRATIATAADELAERGVEGLDAAMLTGIVANMAFAFAGRERTEAAPPTGDDLFDWVLSNTIQALLDDRGRAPWRSGAAEPSRGS